MAAAAELVYRYPFASSLEVEQGKPRLRLAASMEALESPHFFEGRMLAPRAFGDLMLTLSNVVRANFFKPVNVLMLDPVITASSSRLRFEGFSGCCGAYVQVGIPAEAIDGMFHRRGTTNVDFNDPMRAALTRLSDQEATRLSVGTKEVVLESGAGSVVEKKVKLPTRWVRGFCESHIYQSRLAHFADLTGAQARQLMQVTPKSVQRRPLHLVYAGGRLRWSTVDEAGSMRVGGAHRLAILEPLIRQASSLSIWADQGSSVSAWMATTPSGNLMMMLSPEVDRGFSGEGQALEALADPEGQARVAQVRAQLAWQDSLDVDALATKQSCQRGHIQSALVALGTQGLVGFDLQSQAYFHRELPFGPDAVARHQARLAGAKNLAASESVTPATQSGADKAFDVSSGEAVYRVTLRGGQWGCTCPWYGKHRGTRGPCKHVLAAQLQAVS